MGGARLPLALLCTLALALATAGCGGGSSTPKGAKPAEWVGALCGAFLEWGHDVTTNQQIAFHRFPGKSDSAVKERTVAGLAADIKATEKLIRAIDAGQAPAVERGSIVKQHIESSLREIRDKFARQKAVAENLPLTDHRAFMKALASLQRGIDKALSTASPGGLALRELKKEGLKKEFDADAACQTLPR